MSGIAGRLFRRLVGRNQPVTRETTAQIKASKEQIFAKQASDRLTEDSSLRRKASPIGEFSSPLVHKTIKNLKQIAKRESLSSLSAPQVGRSLRLFVLDLDPPSDFSVIINPRIIDFGGIQISEEEYCCSLPGFTFDVKRYPKARVEYHNEEGVLIEKELIGLPARCFQHEMDHLEGKLVTDYANSPLDFKPIDDKAVAPGVTTVFSDDVKARRNARKAS
ncbi:hypothetical protein AAMO2058_000623900 [Amorphochlora amoebiformis]